MNLGGYSATGPREANEDNYYVIDFSDVRSFTNGVASFIMVSDGMGGYNGGDIASSLAVSSAESYIRQLLDIAEGNQIDFDAPYALGEISQNAHDAIVAETRELGSTSMGATFIGAFLSATHAWIGHVGDSRAYLVRDGVATQLTEDHSQVGRMLSQGLITEEEAQNHPARNRIERALGFSDATPDITEVDLQPGDMLLLCSDGVYTVLNSQAIAGCLARANDAENAAKRLVKVALNKGTDDNSTAVVAMNVQQPAEQMPSWEQQQLQQQTHQNRRTPQPTLRVKTIGSPQHGSAEQYKVQDAADQYRIENYRGRTSQKPANHKPQAVRPSVAQLSAQGTSSSRPAKSIVIPIAVVVVLAIAIGVIYALSSGDTGQGEKVTGAQQQTVNTPSGVAQPNASQESSTDSQPGETLRPYSVAQGALLKYVDKTGVAHRFSEEDGLNAYAEVLLSTGVQLSASAESSSYGMEPNEYLALDSSYLNDFLGDYEAYKANQAQPASELSQKVSDSGAYVSLLQELVNHDALVSATGAGRTVADTVDKLIVDKTSLT